MGKLGMENIDFILFSHRQLGEMTCASSAHEFIAKLHGKLAVEDFPLQSGEDAGKAGWDFDEFLRSIGFTGQPLELLPVEAIAVLSDETENGRFPLVSVDEVRVGNQIACHVLVAVPTVNGVGLVDPGRNEFRTKSSENTLRELERSASLAPRLSQIMKYTPIGSESL